MNCCGYRYGIAFAHGEGRLPARRLSSKLCFNRRQGVRRSVDMSNPSSGTERQGRANGRVALLWRGDRAMQRAVTPGNNRLHRIFEALAQAGVHAEPIVYAEEFEGEVRTRLKTFDGILVWVDPLSDGKSRAKLDPLLREVAAAGAWVSAHPDTILKMGVKEVLHRTRQLG